MTEFLKVAFLAVFQGIAEFLPVSSSGHLVIGQELLGLESPGTSLEIALHAGTLLSVFVFYGVSISSLACGMFRGRRAAFRYALAVFVSMIPCGLAYAFLGDWLKAVFDRPVVVGPCWLLTAALMFAMPRADAKDGDGLPGTSDGDRLHKVTPRADARGADANDGDRLPAGAGLRPIPLWIALLTGLGQAVAMLPGVSRSGTTIWVARRCRVPAADAARFSFLMSLPVIAGATLLMVADLGAEAGAAEGAQTLSGWTLAGGATISAVVGYASLSLLVRMLARGRFWVFGVYCAVAGVAAIVRYGFPFA